MKPLHFAPESRLLIVCFHLAALRRRDRTPFHIAVDEFHSFGASTFADMLSGIRKYGVSLTLANQYVDQLDNSLRAAVIGTVGIRVSFAIGAKDAAMLAADVLLKADDLVLPPPYTAYISVGGRAVHVSMFHTLAKRFRSASRRIVRRCRSQLAKPREEIEAKLSRMLGEHVKQLSR